jgi:hypothetical protein
MPTDTFPLSHYRLIVIAIYFLPAIRYLAVEHLLRKQKEYALRNWHVIAIWNLIQVFVLWTLWSELRLEHSLSLVFEQNSKAFDARLIFYTGFLLWDIIKIKIDRRLRKTYFIILGSDFFMIATSTYVWLNL